MVVFLWSVSVFLASVHGALMSAITLTPKYGKAKMALGWSVTGLVAFLAAYLSYSVNLYNDTTGILGLTLLVCAAVCLLYTESIPAKLFVTLIACLVSKMCTFMLCGTTDKLLARPLGLIKESAYEVPNILFIIAIRIFFYTLIFLLYRRILVLTLQDLIKALGKKINTFLVAPVVSFLGFYITNYFTTKNGIEISASGYFLFYSAICLVIIVEFWLLFHAILWTTRISKTEAELGVATKIQQSILPTDFPAFPERDEFDIHAIMDPAREVGGDFYDFFLVDASHLAVVVADVSDKGVPAALFMVIGKTLIKDHTRPGADLGCVFSEVNNLLCEANEESMFITAFEGVLDLKTGDFTFVNAGHEMPFLSRQGEAFAAQKIKAGFVLAGLEDIPYQAGQIKLAPGDRFFQYSDGVPEAVNEKQELYGMERLGLALNRYTGKGMKGLLEEVQKDMAAFVGKADQFDDITMLGLEFKKYMD